MKNKIQNRHMDEELHRIFLQAGRREAPEGLSQRIMNRVNAETEKPASTETPLIGRKVWIAIALFAVLGLVLTGFLGDRTFTMNDVVPAFIKDYAQKLRSFTIPLPEFPVWPVFLSMVALLGYCFEDFLIRRYLRKK